MNSTDLYLMKFIFPFLIALVIIGCYSKKSAISTTEKKAQSSTVAKPGESLYKKYCGTCHAFKNLTLYKKEELESIVPNMCDQVDSKFSMKLTQQERSDLLNYTINTSFGQ
jgi:hypothetical protein